MRIRQRSGGFRAAGVGLGAVLAMCLGAGCKRDRSDAPAPDPLTAPTQSAPSTTEIAPVGQTTDTPPAVTSSPPPPANHGSGTGTGTGSGSGSSGSKKKKDDDKKDEDKSGDKSCFGKCQSAFMTCMTPKTSGGGFPQPPDPEACRSALQSCQGACQ